MNWKMKKHMRLVCERLTKLAKEELQGIRSPADYCSTLGEPLNRPPV